MGWGGRGGLRTAQSTQASHCGWDWHQVLLCAAAVLLQWWPATQLHRAMAALRGGQRLCCSVKPHATDSPTRRHCLHWSFILWPFTITCSHVSIHAMLQGAKELTYRSTRNIRAWLLPIIPVFGPLVCDSSPREVSELVERKVACKSPREIISMSSESFLPSCRVPHWKFWTVSHVALQLGNLAGCRGAGPTACSIHLPQLHKGAPFPPNRAGLQWDSCQAKPHPFPGAESVLHAVGKPEDPVQHSPTMAWWEYGCPGAWGLGGCEAEESRRLGPRPLPCPHVSTAQAQPSQDRREAVNIQDFHHTTHGFFRSSSDIWK